MAALSGRPTSGDKACICKLTVRVDGETVSTCARFPLQHAQRSVSLAGFPRASLETMLFCRLGYDKANKQDQAEAEMIAARLAEKTDGRNYLISIAHFPPAQLHFTAKQVSLVRTTAAGKPAEPTAICPSVPAAVVHARVQLMRANMPPADALAAQLPAARPRLSPDGRVYRGDKRLVEQVLGIDESPSRGAEPKLRRPADATTVGTGKRAARYRRLSAALDDGRAHEQEVKRLEDEFDAVAAHSGDLAAELANTKEQVRELTEKLAEVNLEKDLLKAAVEGSDRALRDALASRARADSARETALAQVAAARAAAADFTPWRTRMLADTRGLGKLVRELTTFRSLSAFKTFFDAALDGQGCTRAGWAGQAARLDYWYAPKHNGSASAAASARAPADGGKWPQQLNPLKPGGLDSPFEACFLTMATLRLGLSADDAAVLFGISSGSASIIFNTWVPFISRALTGITPWPDGATVAARLPEKFKTKLARTTHSKRCRIIIDCTEFEIQTPNDDTMRKLY